ncbi:MAG: hypothetical protein WC777_03725 [Candidatus Gracilibacteria bacterium]|jgi:hypothetical protein
MENSGDISVIEALNLVQSWLNAKEYDKVVQGCLEILQLEPGNARALSLMRQAEERRHAAVSQPAPAPTAAPAPAPAANPAPVPDPLASLQVESAPDLTLPEEETEENEDEGFEKRKLFLALLIPAVVVILLGGSGIWWLANRDREETIEDSITDDEEQDLTYLEENDQRVKDMTAILEEIEAYKEETGAYPAAAEIETILEESDAFETIPSDPRQGEIDKAGEPFGYLYAVYDGIGGENSVFVLSALFEDQQGFGVAWAKGAPIRNYPDFRDYEKDNIVFVGGKEKGPKVNPNK